MRWVEAVSHRRNPQCIRCRDEIAWTLVETYQWTYSRVGKLMAGRDHTTLITAVRRHRDRVKADAAEAARG
jgi:chromosomal replication initiation ATPase DnaA